MTCSLCTDRGFVRVKARETFAVHEGPQPRLRDRLVDVRIPCECEAGARWQRERERAPSKK